VNLSTTRTDKVGDQLFTTFVLPFEVVSFLLLAALIGAIVLARRDEDATAPNRSRPPRSLQREEAVRR
jgi:NADH-quinone oxidoreductase subunit J